MTETKLNLETSTRENNTAASTPRWISRAIRCRACRELVRESARQRVGDNETVVQFECGYCCHLETRHYVDEMLGMS